MTDPSRIPDELLARIRMRAADPGKRTGAAEFEGAASAAMAGMGVRRMSLGPFSAMMGSGVPGQPAMSESQPEDEDLPAPADAETLASVEAELGFALPAGLRQLYGIADGGFGPGSGLLPVWSAVGEYREQTREPAGPQGQLWPERLLPIVDTAPGYVCLDAGSGAVIRWDAEELANGLTDADWRRSFKREAPDLAAWFEAWLGAPSEADLFEQRMMAERIDTVKRALELCRAMSAEQRSAMGLDGPDWEDQLCRNHGLDPSLLREGR